MCENVYNWKESYIGETKYVVETWERNWRHRKNNFKPMKHFECKPNKNIPGKFFIRFQETPIIFCELFKMYLWEYKKHER